MRIVFVGGLKDGHMVLKYLLDRNENVVGIFVLDPAYSYSVAGYLPLEPLAASKGIPCYRVKHINNEAENIRKLNPDLIFVVGWSQLVSKEIIDIPKYGCIGFHSSLLPRRRGRSPIVWAIVDGLTETGVTMFYLTEGVDDGDIIAKKKFSIDIEHTASDVLAEADKATLDLIEENLPMLERRIATRIPQDNRDATYTRKRGEKDQIIDWDKGTLEIYNLVRALTHPYPGAFTFLNGRKLFIWQAKLPIRAPSLRSKVESGQIMDLAENGFYVATGNGWLLITEVQLDGDTQMTGSELIKKYRVKSRTVLGSKGVYENPCCSGTS